MRQDSIKFLVSLGFNHLEAEIYILLLSQEPMTAYRAGKLLEKPTANVYKAIESLSRKGAVIVEEGNNRLCRAIDPKEFLNQLKLDFIHKTKRASDALSNLKPEIDDERIYQLKSLPLVIERCNKMLENCQTIAIIDAFPKPLNAIKSAIEAAAKRGVEIVIQAYQPIKLEGVQVALTHEYKKVLEYWKSQQLNVVIDGKEHLLALFDSTFSNVYQATWSKNLYLSCMHHAGLFREHTIHQLMAVEQNENMTDKITEILERQKFFYNSMIPGQKELFLRYSTLDYSQQED